MGKKLPKNPDNVTHFHSVFEMFLMDLNPIKKRKNPANTIRTAPSCKGENP